MASIERASIPMELAACRDVDAFVLDPEPGNDEAESAARRICSGCEVRMECLSVALKSPGVMGIWGGFTRAERERIHDSALLRPVGQERFGNTQAR
jgi:WhiB family redox-sensing transcriptional regulator